LNEKRERQVRWSIRAFTLIGVVASGLSLVWYLSLILSVLLVTLAGFLERTLFYYSTLYVDALMSNYNPDEWKATLFMRIGDDSTGFKQWTVGLVFLTKEYAIDFFNTLYQWNGREDLEQQDLRLTFLIDENSYFVYLYSDPEKDRFQLFKNKVEEEKKFEKFGKEHFPIIMQMMICKRFEITNQFPLGIFLEDQPEIKDFFLGAFLWNNGRPEPVLDVHPITMTRCKAVIPKDLTPNDQEYFHWHRIVSKDVSYHLP
jgi:hypothetical protein